MAYKTRADLVQLHTDAQIIEWLTGSARATDGDIGDRLETIANLAEQLAEDARGLIDDITNAKGTSA